MRSRSVASAAVCVNAHAAPVPITQLVVATLTTMDEHSGSSHWERSPRKGPRPLIALIFILLVVGGGCTALTVWLINAPGLRVAQEVYDQAPNIVNRTHYSSTPWGDTLTVVVARDVIRDEALDLQCKVVLPLMLREHLDARIEIVHPDNEFRLDGEPCPTGRVIAWRPLGDGEVA